MDKTNNRAVDQIPLLCNVCPKKPTFSDLSHLLTHVASKGHLSNRFKMGINARQDATAHQIYTDYENWEKTHGIQDLMRDRLNQKEKKKGNVAASRRSSATHASSQRSTPSAVAPTASRGRVSTLREDTLDPMLDRRVKYEDFSRPTTPMPPYGNPFDLAHLHHRSYAPPMQSWSASPYSLTQDNIKQEPDVEFLSSDSFDPEPIPRQAPPRRSTRVRASTSNVPIIINEDENDNGEDVNNEKLKGIVWPGMSLWDSATPEMQRKRNQKKAVSVVLNLQRTSTQVEPFELIFDQSGEFRKKRNINDDPDSDDSLIKGESSPEPPTKKRAVRRPRKALSEKDPNTNRRTSRRQPDAHHTDFGNRNNPYYLHGEDEDDALTYHGSRSKARLGVSIHRDNSGPEITFDNPASLDTLTWSFRHPNESFHSQPMTTCSSMYRNDSTGSTHRPTIPAGCQNVPSVPGIFRPAQTDYSQDASDYTSFTHMHGSGYQQGADAHIPNHSYDSLGMHQHYNNNFNSGYNFYSTHDQTGVAEAGNNFTGYDMLGSNAAVIKPELVSPTNNHHHSAGDYMTSYDNRLADFFGVGGNPLFLSSGNHNHSPNNEDNEDNEDNDDGRTISLPDTSDYDPVDFGQFLHDQCHFPSTAPGNTSNPFDGVLATISPSLPPPGPAYTLLSQPDLEIMDPDRPSFFAE